MVETNEAVSAYRLNHEPESPYKSRFNHFKNNYDVFHTGQQKVVKTFGKELEADKLANQMNKHQRHMQTEQIRPGEDDDSFVVRMKAAVNSPPKKSEPFKGATSQSNEPVKTTADYQDRVKAEVKRREGMGNAFGNKEALHVAKSNLTKEGYTMSEAIRDIIINTIADQPVGVKAAIDTAIQEKISGALEARKIEVARNLVGLGEGNIPINGGPGLGELSSAKSPPPPGTPSFSPKPLNPLVLKNPTNTNTFPQPHPLKVHEEENLEEMDRKTKNVTNRAISSAQKQSKQHNYSDIRSDYLTKAKKATNKQKSRILSKMTKEETEIN